MAKEGLVRCVSVTTGKVRFVIPLLANNATRLKKLGFVAAEIEAPKVKTKKVLKPVPENPVTPVIPDDSQEVVSAS